MNPMCDACAMGKETYCNKRGYKYVIDACGRPIWYCKDSWNRGKEAEK